MQTAGKRILALAAVIAAAALTACGKGEAEEEPKWTYVPEFVTLDEESADLYRAKVQDGKVYYLSYQWDEETGGREDVCSYSLEDRTTQKHTLVWPEGLEDYNLNRFAIAGDGAIYAVAYSWEGEWNEEKNALVKFDADGKGVFGQDISEAVGDTYIDTLLVDSQGRIYLVCNETVLLYDVDGKAAGSVSLEAAANGWIREVFCGGDGKVYMNYVTYDGTTSSNLLAEIDFDKKKLGDAHANFPGGNNVAAGTEWDFLVEDGAAVYGYSIEREEKEKLFDWLSSDINGSSVNGIAVLEDGRVAAVIRDWENGDNCVALLTKTETSQVAKRENIVIATMYRAYGIQSYAAAFNRSNDKYRITIREYIDYDNYNENSWKDALTRLNNDLTSSNCPDLIDLSALNIAQLAAAGAFEDLGKYLDASSEFSRSDFLESVLEAYTFDGKLVSIPTSFSISTVAGSGTQLGDKWGWTLEELIAYADEHPDAELFDRVSKSEILQGLLLFNQDAFIDWEKGDCSFDSDAFKHLLEFVNRFPEEPDYDKPYVALRIQSGEVLLNTVDIYEFENVQENAEMYEGKVAWVGYPTVDGQRGHAFQGDGTYAITAKSRHKEGAWAFLENYLTSDSQRYRSGFPTQKSKLDAMIAEAMQEYYLDENGDPYLDEEGNPIPRTGGSVSYNGVWTYEYHIVTQEEVDTVLKMMDNMKLITYNQGDELMQIIAEEAEAFYKGQKSVDDVAAVIQSRAKMYVSTNS